MFPSRRRDFSWALRLERKRQKERTLRKHTFGTSWSLFLLLIHCRPEVRRPDSELLHAAGGCIVEEEADPAGAVSNQPRNRRIGRLGFAEDFFQHRRFFS